MTTTQTIIHAAAKDADDAGKPGYEAKPNGELLRICGGDTAASLRLREAIQSLPDATARDIVYRCVILEESVADVASDMRKSRATVARILWDSIQSLKVSMGAE